MSGLPDDLVQDLKEQFEEVSQSRHIFKIVYFIDSEVKSYHKKLYKYGPPPITFYCEK